MNLILITTYFFRITNLVTVSDVDFERNALKMCYLFVKNIDTFPLKVNSGYHQKVKIDMPIIKLKYNVTEYEIKALILKIGKIGFLKIRLCVYCVLTYIIIMYIHNTRV